MLLLVAAGAARGEVVTWFWEVGDTGNGDGIIEPGESALLTLWAAFDPPQPQDGGMFAEAGPYDIVGDARWGQGVVHEYDNLLDEATGEGILGEGNRISEVEHFQYAVVWDTDNDERNPIPLYFIRWAPPDDAQGTVTLDNGGPDALIYTDPYGITARYAGAGGAVSFEVVPAPASAAVGLAALALATRRRTRHT
jgi:MYXO-CTERM domain-containing protein